jgi:predicted O-methyltransferase YrrM
MEFKLDGKSAVPEPAESDKSWKPKAFEPLAPSRTDGKPTFSNTWFVQHEPIWTRVLAPFKGKPNLRYLEVGVFEGRSFLWMFENILTDPSSRAVAVDLFYHDGLEKRFRENLERAGIADRTETLVGYSNDMLRPMKKDSFDIIYIDASHTADNVIRDAVLAWDLLKRDGVLIFDDYAYRPNHPDELKPKVVIDAFITAFRDELKIVHRGWQLAVQRVADPCPWVCSSLGPYEYHWKDDGSGTLVDPRTKARVPLSDAESKVVQGLLKSRPFGTVDIVVPPETANHERVKALRKKLNI